MEELRDLDYLDPALDPANSPTKTNITIGRLDALIIDGNGMTVTVTDPGFGYKQIQVDIDWDEPGQFARPLNVSLLTFAGP